MNQRKKDIMKIRIIQAYAVCKAFLDAYRNEENLKSLEEFGDVVDEISAFVDAFDNSPLFQTLKDISLRILLILKKKDTKMPRIGNPYPVPDMIFLIPGMNILPAQPVTTVRVILGMLLE